MGSGVTQFEDLIAWQKARALTSRLYASTKAGEFSRDFGLRDQIRRAAVIIMANIAEGFERSRAGEFHQFLSVAKASCAELRSHLYVALDAGYVSQTDFAKLHAQAAEVGRLVGGLRASLNRKRSSA